MEVNGVLEALARVEDILRWAAIPTPQADLGTAPGTDFGSALEAAEGAFASPAGEVVAADAAASRGGTWVSRLPAPGRRWASAIEETARRHGLDPALLAALVWAESSFRPDAVSEAGAIGLTQLMPHTAAGLGVDPRDPLENLEGGARYLAAQIRRFGSVELGLAAYQAGPAAVAAAGGIPSAGTRAYVERVLGYVEALTGIPRAPGPTSSARAVPEDLPPPGAPLPSMEPVARTPGGDGAATAAPLTEPPRGSEDPGSRAAGAPGDPRGDRSPSVGMGGSPAGEVARAGWLRDSATVRPPIEPSAPVEVPGAPMRGGREVTAVDHRGIRRARTAPSTEAPVTEPAEAPVEPAALGTAVRGDAAAHAPREAGPAHGAAARVVELVERLRDAAPPRRMAVELPELGGLRLLLEARGTTIHVRPLGGDPVWFDALVRDLGPSLAARGFDLAGSPGRDPREPDEPLPRGEVRGPRRRMREGVRI